MSSTWRRRHNSSQLVALSNETGPAGDSIEKLSREAMTLADPAIPRERRQARVAELLALDDPEAIVALQSALVAGRGSTLEGKPIPPSEAGLYRLAWDVTLCETYGRCAGPDSTFSHNRCFRDSDCQYLPTPQLVYAMTPPFYSGSVNDYVNRIRQNLGRRNFAAFGVP